MMNNPIRTTVLFVLLLTFTAVRLPSKDYRLLPSFRNTESRKE